MVFGREINERVLTFGVSGLLRDSNLVMWDHETESWWQQGTFEAIVGEMAGTQMPLLPAPVMAWQDFKAQYPGGKVLSRATGGFAPYGANPYGQYDTLTRPPLFDKEVDDRLPTMERVVGIKSGDEAVAYPFSALEDERVVYDRLGDREIVVLHAPGVRTALGAGRIAEGRDVGTAGVFVPQVGGTRLTLEPAQDGRFRDQETGSLWTVFGQGAEGPLAGERLPPVLHSQQFWFYWAELRPETRIHGAPESSG